MIAIPIDGPMLGAVRAGARRAPSRLARGWLVAYTSRSVSGVTLV